MLAVTVAQQGLRKIFRKKINRDIKYFIRQNSEWFDVNETTRYCILTVSCAAVTFSSVGFAFFIFVMIKPFYVSRQLFEWIRQQGK